MARLRWRGWRKLLLFIVSVFFRRHLPDDTLLVPADVLLGPVAVCVAVDVEVPLDAGVVLPELVPEVTNEATVGPGKT